MANLSHLNRVLAVEDEGIILMDLEGTLLEARVQEVVGAASTQEAIVALETTQFDAAVLDLHIGNSWSHEVARRLRALRIPFIFTSGSAEAVEDFREVPLITKPFSADQLLAALLQVTTGRNLEAAE